MNESQILRFIYNWPFYSLASRVNFCFNSSNFLDLYFINFLLFSGVIAQESKVIPSKGFFFTGNWQMTVNMFTISWTTKRSSRLGRMQFWQRRWKIFAQFPKELNFVFFFLNWLSGHVECNPVSKFWLIVQKFLRKVQRSFHSYERFLHFSPKCP